jgi:sulfate/thiosulfate transport system permease protein
VSSETLDHATVPRPKTSGAGPPASRMARAAAGRWGLRSIALLYLGLMIALPAVAVIQRGFTGGFASLRDALAEPGAHSALILTFVMAGVTAVINAILGTTVAYVLVRYRFPGRAILSTFVDIPFAIPTLVTGVMLVALYGPNSPVGGFLVDHGIHVIFARLGILFALLFVTLPLVVRTVQPVLLELDLAEEEAARVLGATRWTTFRRIVLPAILPGVTGGGLLTFARALGEFGSVVVVSGNLLNKTLTAPVFINQLIGGFKANEAAAIATLLFTVSFAVVLITERLTHRGLGPHAEANT